MGQTKYYYQIIVLCALLATFACILFIDHVICSDSSDCLERGDVSFLRTYPQASNVRQLGGTTLNVTRTDDDFPDTLSLKFLRWFWFTLVFPASFVCCACFCCCYYRFTDAKARLLNESTEIVLVTDYKGSVGSKGMNLSATLMYHAERGIEQKVEEEDTSSILEKTRLKNTLSQILTTVEENMARIGLSPEELMRKGEVEVEPIPGQRSFARKPGLAHWEFINALEQIGVRISHKEADSLCRFLDTNHTGRISLNSFVRALHSNETMLHKRADLMKLTSPLQLDNKHFQIDDALIRFHRGIGLRDISSARRLLDAYNTGYFTVKDFEALVKEHRILLSANEVTQLKLAMKENPKDVNMSTALFGVVLAGSIQRREKSLLMNLLRQKQSVHAIIIPFLGRTRNINDAVEGVVNYNMLLAACKCLSMTDQSQEAATLIGAALADETYGETVDHGALTSSSIRADVLMFACLDSWRDTVLNKGFRFLSQTSAFGHLPGPQASKVLLGGKPQDLLDRVEDALVTHLLGGAGVVSHGVALNGWRQYLSGLLTGFVLCDASGEARKGIATQEALSAYLITLQGLTLHGIFDRLSTHLAMGGQTLHEVLIDASDKRSTKPREASQRKKSIGDKKDIARVVISHETFRNILTTFAIPLYQEEVITLFAKYDKDNEGFISVDEIVKDSRRFAACDDVLAMLSEALGAGGGAQLMLPTYASSIASSAARKYNTEESRTEAAKLASTGRRLPLSVMTHALRKCCEVSLEPGDWENLIPELDPLRTGFITIERFMLLISSHRARRVSRAQSQIIPQWKNKSMEQVLTSFKFASSTLGCLNYEEFVSALNQTLSPLPASNELLRATFLMVDPYGTGKVKLSSLEIAVRKLLAISHELSQHHSQSTQDQTSRQNNSSLDSGKDELADFSMALDTYNSRWRRELTELSAQPKRTKAEELYFSDVTELISINSTTLSCLAEVKEEANMLPTSSNSSQGGFHLARAKKARALLHSKQLRMNLLNLLELQRDLTNLYLLARGFRLHGSDFPASEEKKRLKLLSRLRKYRDDMLLLVKVVGDEKEAILLNPSTDLITTTPNQTQITETHKLSSPEAIVKEATMVWKSRASDRLWAQFAAQLHKTSNKLMNELTDEGLDAYTLLQKQFAMMDDGSGEVTYWEFFEALRKLGAMMDETESDLMVQALDASGSGKIKVDVMLKHFSRVVRETSENPPTTRAISIVTAQLSDSVGEVLNSTAKFMEDVLGTKPLAIETEKYFKQQQMQKFVGQDPDPELAMAAGLPPPQALTSFMSTSKTSTQQEDLKLLAVGTPVLALHRQTGDHFRASVLKDHGDGHVAVQFTLAVLGKCDRISKKDLMTLTRGSELDRVWHEVNKAVRGEEGLKEVVAVASDAAGKISHGGLLAWLQSRGMGEMEKKDKHILLADLDPLCKGVISVNRFKSKVEKFNMKRQAMSSGGGGVKKESQTNGMVAKPVKRQEKGDSDSEEEQDKFLNSVKDIKNENDMKHLEDEEVGVEAEEESEDDVRMQQLESMMLDMAQRERELTMALIESRTKAEQLSKQVDQRGRVAK